MPLPPKEDNPNYPLPVDYQKLSEPAKREARVQACTSWQDPERPTEIITDPTAFVDGFRFFKQYYRKGWKGNKAKYFLESPAMHDEWIRKISNHKHVIITAFRDSGKTFVVGEELPLFLMVCRQNTVVTYTSSAEDLTLKQVRAVRMDIEQNGLLMADFGDIKPPNQRSLKWTQSQIELMNGSAMIAVSADQAQRGITALSLRPNVQILDDWELDSRLRNPELRSNAEDWLFDVFFPCAEQWSKRIWVNTLLSIRSWAMIASRKEDKRFQGWHSAQYDLLEERDGELHSNWPQRVTIEDAIAMQGDGNENIIGYGQAAFSKEFMNDPRSKSEEAFKYDEKQHGFEIKGAGSGQMTCEWHGGVRNYDDLFAKSTRCIGLDLAMGVAGGDYSAIVVCCLDTNGDLWVLDEYVEREPPVRTLAKVVQLADQWKTEFIATEKVHFEQLAIDMLNSELMHRRASGEWSPDVNLIQRNSGKKKELRIMGMQYRFAGNSIKINTKCTNTVDQVTYFTPTGGRLKYDDLLDALVCCEETFRKLGGTSYFNVRPNNSQAEAFKEAVDLGVKPNPGTEHIPAEEIRAEKDRLIKSQGGADQSTQDTFASVWGTGWTDDEYF